MKKNFKFYALLLVLIAAAVLYFGGGDTAAVLDTTLDVLESVDIYAQPLASDSALGEKTEDELSVEEDGWYYSKDEVALYIYTYGRLPDNFVSKAEAEDAGWSGGGLDKYLPGMCIGGDRFGNYEGKLPDAPGRYWTECDIGTIGTTSRGSKRIVFSNDGLIYYTGDHYETFTLLYGEP